METKPADWNILIVEDDQQVARFITRAFESVGRPTFSTAQVDSLERAEAAVKNHRPDLVLLDLGLPDAQGLQGVQRMVQQLPDVPIIVLTGRHDDQLAHEAVRAGAEDFLMKGEVDFRTIFRAAMLAIARRQRRPPTDSLGREEIRRVLSLLDMAVRLHSTGSVTAEDALAAVRNLLEQLKGALESSRG